MKLSLAAITILTIAIASSIASASMIVYGSYSDHGVISGGSLSDVRMQVDFSVANGLGTMTFTNVSTGRETSAVLAEIVLDTHDQDTQTRLLWNPVILTNTSNVSYDWDESNGLPGFSQYTKEAVKLIEFDAKSPQTKKGIGLGESLAVRFNTSLATGSNIQDLFNAFGGGCDTRDHVIGFHAISASTVYGQSLSGMSLATAVPEPAAMSVLLAGGVLLMRRHKVATV